MKFSHLLIPLINGVDWLRSISLDLTANILRTKTSQKNFQPPGLRNQTVFVTGVSSGIGAEIATILLHGAKNLIVQVRSSRNNDFSGLILPEFL